MKTLSSTLLLIAAVALSSCRHTEKPEDIVYDDGLQSTLEIPSYTRTALDGWPEGRKLDPTDSSRVRLPEDVHAYHVGRLPSYDRREMSEAHTVYRVERSARWDQRLPATPMTSRGVVFGINEPTHHPVPADQLVSNERSRQLDISTKLEQRIADLTAKTQKVDAFLASAPDKNKTIQELQQAKAKAEAELNSLKAEHQKALDDLREIRERQAMEDAILKSSKKDTNDKKP